MMVAMGFFVIPQRWITPAILAAALHFGSVDTTTQIRYHRWADPGIQGAAQPPATIWIDKRRHWDKRQVQCLLVHEYGHLRGQSHSRHPRSIMRDVVPYSICRRWLRTHGL